MEGRCFACFIVAVYCSYFGSPGALPNANFVCLIFYVVRVNYTIYCKQSIFSLAVVCRLVDYWTTNFGSSKIRSQTTCRALVQWTTFRLVFETLVVLVVVVLVVVVVVEEK